MDRPLGNAHAKGPSRSVPEKILSVMEGGRGGALTPWEGGGKVPSAGLIPTEMGTLIRRAFLLFSCSAPENGTVLKWD